MGCGTSKLDDEDQLPPQLRPFRSKIEEIKKRRRVRHASIASTTELLRPADLEDEDSVKKAVDGKVTAHRESTIDEEMVKRGDDELPGSPSFRVYCREPAPAEDFDNDSVKVIQKIKDDRLAQEKERMQSIEEEIKARAEEHRRETSRDSLISNEDSTHKRHKKEKGRTLWGLAKAPSRMYSFLAVKSCYGGINNTVESRGGSLSAKQLPH